MQIGSAIMENSIEIPQKTEIYLPYDPAIPLLGTSPKEMKPVSEKYLHSHIHCTIIHNNQDMIKTLSAHCRMDE